MRQDIPRVSPHLGLLRTPLNLLFSQLLQEPPVLFPWLGLVYPFCSVIRFSAVLLVGVSILFLSTGSESCPIHLLEGFSVSYRYILSSWPDSMKRKGSFLCYKHNSDSESYNSWHFALGIGMKPWGGASSALKLEPWKHGVRGDSTRRRRRMISEMAESGVPLGEGKLVFGIPSQSSGGLGLTHIGIYCWEHHKKTKSFKFQCLKFQVRIFVIKNSVLPNTDTLKKIQFCSVHKRGVCVCAVYEPLCQWDPWPSWASLWGLCTPRLQS